MDRWLNPISDKTMSYRSIEGLANVIIMVGMYDVRNYLEIYFLGSVIEDYDKLTLTLKVALK